MTAGEGAAVTGSAAYKRLEPRIRTRLTATSRSRDAFKLYLCIGSNRFKLTTEGLVCVIINFIMLVQETLAKSNF